ncbi:hypothetical protein ACVLD2_004479 [Paenibacillus sp. PvR052]
MIQNRTSECYCSDEFNGRKTIGSDKALGRPVLPSLEERP